jgi:uncharacterized protein (TIGR01244 family)
MEARKLTPRYFVSPQISSEDLPAIAAAGFTTVICNRPDVEVPLSHGSTVMETAAVNAGLKFEKHELTHQTMTPANVARQKALIEGSEGPVLAYCASGTRSSVVWALSQAGDLSADEILTATTRAGYQLEGLRPALEYFAANQG